MRNAGVRYKEWGTKHCVAPIRSDASGFRFTFVREPAEWVKSRWTLGPWEDELKSFWCPNPDEFSMKVSEPMVDMYFDKYRGLCSFVGRMDSLADDLAKVLRQAGEPFCERDLRATPRINESNQHLDRGAYYDLMPDQWCGLPAEDIVRIPTDLLPQLPDRAWDRLSQDQMRRLARRLASEAVPARPRDLAIRIG